MTIAELAKTVYAVLAGIKTTLFLTPASRMVRGSKLLDVTQLDYRGWTATTNPRDGIANAYAELLENVSIVAEG